MKRRTLSQRPNPLALMGRFPSSMHRFPTLLGRFPKCLNGPFSLLKFPSQRALQDIQVSRGKNSLARGDHPNSWKNAPRMPGQLKIQKSADVWKKRFSLGNEGKDGKNVTSQTSHDCCLIHRPDPTWDSPTSSDLCSEAEERSSSTLSHLVLVAAVGAPNVND